MYVCMNACMYVCTYVCMYVRTYVFMCAFMYTSAYLGRRVIAGALSMWGCRFQEAQVREELPHQPAMQLQHAASHAQNFNDKSCILNIHPETAQACILAALPSMAGRPSYTYIYIWGKPKSWNITDLPIPNQRMKEDQIILESTVGCL